MRKPIYGVGINDADYFVQKKEKINGQWVKTFYCPFYAVWTSMLTRVYSKKYFKSRPTYQNVAVCEEWHKFSNFKKWMEQQDWEGKHLDKDLLSCELKIYSPETCVFISLELNNFIIDKHRNNTSGYTGVFWRKDIDMWRAKIVNPFNEKEEHLGHFSCPKQAHEAWRKRKHELALIYAEQQTDERIKQALQNRYSEAAWHQ